MKQQIPIEGTPLLLILNKNEKYRLVFGKYILRNEEFTEEEAIEYVNNNTLNIALDIAAIVNEISKEINQQNK